VNGEGPRSAGAFSFIWVQWRENRFAAALFIPYAAWVAFASLLNYSIYRLNWRVVWPGS
jgi:tryptophan-rich sensory protein